jgi:hypothetical protein
LLGRKPAAFTVRDMRFRRCSTSLSISASATVISMRRSSALLVSIATSVVALSVISLSITEKIH